MTEASGPRLLPTAVVGSYAVPDWLGRFKTDRHRGRLSAAGLAERYVPLGPLDCYEIAGGLHGEVLQQLADGHGDVRFHASNGAIESLLDTVPLL
ncbi:MAG: hypothetical protein ACRDNO_26100, partial [Trebonia sp.]